MKKQILIYTRLNEVSVQDNITALQKQTQQLSSQQGDLFKSITQHYNEFLAQQQGLTETTIHNASQIQNQISKILAHQTSILSMQRLQVVKAGAEVTDAKAVADLIRLELRQQLEPILKRIDGATEHIDRIATAFSSGIITKSLLKTETSCSALKVADNVQVDMPNIKHAPGETLIGPICVMASSNPQTRIKRQNVFQSSVTHRISTWIGELSITVRTYRQRRLGIYSRRFQLRADIIPQPWLCCRGLCMLYSSEPDRHGYINICPSISIINVIPFDSELYSLMKDDDLTGFRQLLGTGRVGIWDVNDLGWGLLQVCCCLQSVSTMAVKKKLTTSARLKAVTHL